MSVLRTIEQRIEGVVERTFGRIFRSTLQPVELARKLGKEMEDHKTVSVSRVYVPNEYTVFLSEADRDSFSAYEASLVAELQAYLAAHARGEGLSMLSDPVVVLETDTDLRVGEFGIACRMVDPPAPDPSEAEEAAPDEALPPPAPAPVGGPPTRIYEPLAGVYGTQILSAEDARSEGLAREVVTLEVADRAVEITKRITTIGRSRDCDVVVPDPNVSRVHAEVRHAGLDYLLVDMGSTNGTRVNGRDVKRHALADGDVIVMGTSEITVRREG
jgi:hypothetical protein